jgi:hypothetical protein
MNPSSRVRVQAVQSTAALSLSFDSFVINHVTRSANTPAHLCVKRACTLMVTSSWLDGVPDFLVVSIQVDQAGAVVV